MIRTSMLFYVLVLWLNGCGPSEPAKLTGESNQTTPHNYETLRKNISAYWTKNTVDELRKYHVIMVPGFLSNIVVSIGQVSGFKELQLGEYFDEQMQLFSALNVENTRLAIESEASPEDNAKVIANAVRESTKKVLLLTHSKGGLDTLVSLMDHPDISEKIAGWASVQGAIHGSPVADLTTNSKFSRLVTGKLLEALNGSEKSLLSMRTETRKAYLASNAANISAVVKKFPVISYASQVDGVTMLAATRDIMKLFYRIPNDGLVPVDYAILPGTHFVKDVGVDHAVPVMHCRILDFDRVTFTKTLLLMLLERIDN